MNARPNAWLRQADNDLALAQLARDNGFLAQACFYASQAAEKGLKSALLELGDEPPHTHVLNDLVDRLKQEHGVPARTEGRDTGDWVLIDTGDVIVHVFRPEVREFYQLEKMWMPIGQTAATQA